VEVWRHAIIVSATTHSTAGFGSGQNRNGRGPESVIKEEYQYSSASV
jgi:hypothetical protein